MTPTPRSDRRQLLTKVRDGLAAALLEPLDEVGFQFRRRDAVFRRERDGVVLSIFLGISSRPASMGGVGILVEPMMVVAVPGWEAEAVRRLAAASGPLVHWEQPSEAVISEALDWHIPGKRPHWTLPNEPTPSDIARLGGLLRESAIAVGLPFLERVSTRDRLLDISANGEVRVIHEARLAIACGAMLRGRPDLADIMIEPYGTARRESVARVLGLTG
jgi:hypothetical protein